MPKESAIYNSFLPLMNNNGLKWINHGDHEEDCISSGFVVWHYWIRKKELYQIRETIFLEDFYQLKWIAYINRIKDDNQYVGFPHDLK